MDSIRSHRFLPTALAFAVLAGLLVGACAPNQSAIDQAVDATRAADKLAADTLATALAGTLAAMPSATPASIPGPSVAPTPAGSTGPSTPVCEEGMADLAFLSSGYLEGGRFLVTLEKPRGGAQPFQAEAYSLLVNDFPYTCTLIGADTYRIYCSGRPVPPVGHARVQLLSADSSCTFVIPFDTVLVPPPPAAKPSGGY